MSSYIGLGYNTFPRSSMTLAIETLCITTLMRATLSLFGEIQFWLRSFQVVIHNVAIVLNLFVKALSRLDRYFVKALESKYTGPLAYKKYVTQFQGKQCQHYTNLH